MHISASMHWSNVCVNRQTHTHTSHQCLCPANFVYLPEDQRPFWTPRCCTLKPCQNITNLPRKPTGTRITNPRIPHTQKKSARYIPTSNPPTSPIQTTIDRSLFRHPPPGPQRRPRPWPRRSLGRCPPRHRSAWRCSVGPGLRGLLGARDAAQECPWRCGGLRGNLPEIPRFYGKNMNNHGFLYRFFLKLHWG